MKHCLLKEEKRVFDLLIEGGFNIVIAEGNKEYEKKLNDYKKTPEFIQSPFIGGGSPDDFFIDVISPSGSYLNKKASNIGRIIDQSWEEKKILRIVNQDILQEERERLVNAINEKIEKYKRENSPLLGLVYYFDLRDSKIKSSASKGLEPTKTSFNFLDLNDEQKEDFKKEFYLYVVFIHLLDSMFGTSLITDGTIREENKERWEQIIIDIFDNILFKNPIKRYIEIPNKKFHSKSSFFILIIDLPKDIQQIIMFFPHPVMTTKVYENNIIIQHLRKLINSSKIL